MTHMKPKTFSMNGPIRMKEFIQFYSFLLFWFVNLLTELFCYVTVSIWYSARYAGSTIETICLHKNSLFIYFIIGLIYRPHVLTPQSGWPVCVLFVSSTLCYNFKPKRRCNHWPQPNGKCTDQYFKSQLYVENPCHWKLVLILLNGPSKTRERVSCSGELLVNHKVEPSPVLSECSTYSCVHQMSTFLHPRSSSQSS